MGESLTQHLERLRELHRAGALTDDEFSAAKARLLADPGGQAGADGHASAPLPPPADSGDWISAPPPPPQSGWSPPSDPGPSSGLGPSSGPPASLPGPPGGAAVGATAQRDHKPAPRPLRERGLHVLGIWTQVLLWLCCATAGLSALLALSGWATYDDWQASSLTSATDVWWAIDDYYAAFGLFAFALLATAVVFIIWLWRTHTQASALAPTREARYGRGWAIGAWFVPFANLVIPKQVVDDVWRRADPAAPSGWHTRRQPAPALFHWWWGLYVGAGLLAQIGGAMEPTGATPSGAGSFFAVNGLSDVLLAVSAALAVFVVRAISHRLSTRARAVMASPPPPPVSGA